MSLEKGKWLQSNSIKDICVRKCHCLKNILVSVEIIFFQFDNKLTCLCKSVKNEEMNDKRENIVNYFHD